MESLYLKTFGAFRHGKTTLVRAVAARLSVPLRSLAFGPENPEDEFHLEYERNGRRHFLHDAYGGHWPMYPGPARLDGAVLVVAADAGPTRLTRSHLVVAHARGVSRLVVFLSKVDRLTDGELLDLTEAEIRETLDRYGFSGDETPIIRGDAEAALESKDPAGPAWRCIDQLLDAVDASIPTPQWPKDDAFLMLAYNWDEPARAERFYKVPFAGTLFTGLILRGRVHPGDEVELLGVPDAPARATVQAVYRHTGFVERAAAGEFAGVVLPGVESPPWVTDRSLLQRMGLARPGTATATSRFTAEVRALATDEVDWYGKRGPLFSGFRAQVYFPWNVDLSATVHFPPEIEMCLPGDVIRVQVDLAPEPFPVPLRPGDPFYLAANGPVAIGRVIESLGQEARRKS